MTDSRERLLAVLKQSNPQAALLTVNDVDWGAPQVNSTYGRNTQLTLTAKPGSGYSGSAVLYYNRHSLSVVFGQHVSLTVDQGVDFAGIVDELNKRSVNFKVPAEQLTALDVSALVLEAFNPLVLAAQPAALDWMGDIQVSVWVKLPNETSPDIALSAVLQLQTRVQTLEDEVLALNAITQGGIVSSVAGFSGNVTREQLGLDRLDEMWDGFAPNVLTRTNQSTDDMVFGQPVYSLGSSVALADARDSNKAAVMGLVADLLITSQGGSGHIQTSGVLNGTVAQWEQATGMAGGLVTGKCYFLDILLGKLTPFAPSEHGHFLTLIGTALSPTELSIDIERPLTL